MNTIPRRAFLNKSTPEELLLRKAIAEVENLGAHPLLTDVVVLLGNAREKLADWVDLQIGQSEREIEALEADIQEFEGMIREEEKSLAYLEGEDYKPEDNPDHEFRDQDIEENNSSIAEYRQNIAKAQSKIASLKSAQHRLQADGLPHSA